MQKGFNYANICRSDSIHRISCRRSNHFHSSTISSSRNGNNYFRQETKTFTRTKSQNILDQFFHIVRPGGYRVMGFSFRLSYVSLGR